MSQNTLTINLPGIEARLDTIIELLRQDCKGCAESAKNTINYLIDHAEEIVAEKAQQAAGETEPEPVEPVTPVEETPAQPVEQPAAPTVSRSDVQQKVVALSAAGKKDAVREIIKAYAERVSAIPEDKLAEVLDKLNALEV